MLYRDGLAGYEQDYEAAERTFRKAMEQGSAIAAGWLGWMYYDGLVTGEPDYAHAVKLFRKGARGKDDVSSNGVAFCHYDGLGVEKDFKKAFRYFEMSEKKNNNVALNMLGWMCEHGEGTRVDLESALEFYQRASELGNEAASTNLENLRQALGDMVKTIESAKDGRSEAQFDLAYSYHTGQNGFPVDFEAARLWYERALKQRHPVAMSNLAWMFLNGEGVMQDRKRALSLFKSSAKLGNTYALYSLGLCYKAPEFFDRELMLRSFSQAAEKGEIAAMLELGHLYWDGNLVERDQEVAYKWYLKAAVAGDALGQWNVGCMNEQGIGTPVNLAEAEKWFLSAAEEGYNGADKAYERIRRRRMLETSSAPKKPREEKRRASDETIRENVRLAKEAFARNDYASAHKYALNADHEDHDIQFILGRCYHLGFGVEKNGEEAVKWLTRSAASGNAEAQAELAAMYHDGDAVCQDYTKSCELYGKSAAAGCMAGIIGLGNALVVGEGIAKNVEKAMRLYQKASDMGSLPCMTHLGRVYLDGTIVPQDIGLACKYLEMAAAAGDVDSHERLGEIYLKDKYGILNYAEALRHFTCAAERGNITSCFYLGVMFERGYGVKIDMAKAIEWYVIAAEDGNASAQFNLGVLYHSGVDVVHDEAKSIEWYTKAAASGDRKAIEILRAKSYSDALYLADKQNAGPYRVFISYRRDGGREFARTLYLALRYRGIKAFFDYTSLQHGDFNQDILKAIEESPNFVLMVTDGSLNRCSDANDWVRKELEYAKKLGKNIVPLAPTGHQKDLSRLPDSLADLRTRQVFRLDMEDNFDESVSKIVKKCLKGIAR